jgi:hypothetical protein
MIAMSDREPSKVIHIDFGHDGAAPAAPASPQEPLAGGDGPVPDLIALVARVSQVQVAQGEQTATIVQQLLLMNRLFERQAVEIRDLRQRVDQLTRRRSAAGSD